VLHHVVYRVFGEMVLRGDGRLDVAAVVAGFGLINDVV